jgi:hypothetical protein
MSVTNLALCVSLVSYPEIFHTDSYTLNRFRSAL